MSSCSPHESVENTACRGHVSIPHAQVQHLGSGDFAERLEFCKWRSGSHQLLRYILFIDKVQFNRDGVNNTHSSHVWADENLHATVESNFELCFSVNVWCAVLDDQLIGPFILDGRLTEEAYLRFLQEELPRLLKDVPLNKRSCMYLQHDRAPPNSSRQVRNFLNCCFPGWWIGCGGPSYWPARSPGLSPLDYCVWGWMKEVVYSVKVVTRDALLGRILDAADHIRNSQWKLQRATCAVHNRAEACVVASGGIFKNEL